MIGGKNGLIVRWKVCFGLEFFFFFGGLESVVSTRFTTYGTKGYKMTVGIYGG
jgi:hypothetical protein